jgi:hypothetical protein
MATVDVNVVLYGLPAGIDRLSSQHPDITIFVGAIDETLSPEGMIVPGLGDAGDRLFGTNHDAIGDGHAVVEEAHEEEAEKKASGSKRKAGAH